MLDKIYQVMKIEEVNDGVGPMAAITAQYGCFLNLEEARRFVEEVILKTAYEDEEIEHDECGRHCIWFFCDHGFEIVIEEEPLIGFDEAKEDYRWIM